MKTVTTGADGKAIIDELDYDKEYILVETKAPNGYVLNKEPVKVNVKDLDEGEAVIKLSVKNDKDNKTNPPANVPTVVKKYKAPETGDSSNISFYLVTGVVALLMLLGLIGKNHRKNN
ncbi:prealbumin-like fold domain-containing protein [Streptococcus suis]|uniref:prealbumin-like fold domain-containing protein n=1 Tax=Streptococcus TaxID=1301 RepID=UPI00211C700A|nr:prealbumin-like fold domain-containing protein [Streptococcus suis]UUM58795.1 prealbumin-like fold domain-containing protein [Streptococcus suis]UUM63088.1 prealbumin-like fold domain-containing protein [Streptococcus suis]